MKKNRQNKRFESLDNDLFKPLDETQTASVRGGWGDTYKEIIGETEGGDERIWYLED